MKNHLVILMNKLLHRKRLIIEILVDKLKSSGMRLEHTPTSAPYPYTGPFLSCLGYISIAKIAPAPCRRSFPDDFPKKQDGMRQLCDAPCLEGSDPLLIVSVKAPWLLLKSVTFGCAKRCLGNPIKKGIFEKSGWGSIMLSSKQRLLAYSAGSPVTDFAFPRLWP